jgi:hypothetical protein
MAVSDDLGEVTKYLISLAEHPNRLAEYRKDPESALSKAGLSAGARTYLTGRRGPSGDAIIIIILIVAIV